MFEKKNHIKKAKKERVGSKKIAKLSEYQQRPFIAKATKKSFFIRMLSESTYKKFRTMGNSDLSIIKWQKNRVVMSLSSIPVGLVVGVLLNDKLYALGGLVFSVILYWMQAKNLSSQYKQFKFERHLQFSKFTRLLIPYLKQRAEGGNLYGVFNKILTRLDHETDKNLLMNLMQEMTDNPNSINPFLNYAEKTSGSDMSILFMSTVYDIRQGSADLEVIEELDRIASEELMAGVDAIIDFKCKKFTFFPTKMTMSTFILIIGFAVGIVLSSLSSFKLSGF